MKTKQLLKISITILLIFLNFEILARGGGGGHSSGHHSGWRRHWYSSSGEGKSFSTLAVVILTGIILAVSSSTGYFVYKLYNFTLSKKSLAAKAIITNSEEEDPIWEHEQLIKTVENAFIKIQKAWMDRSMKNVQHLVSIPLHDRYQHLLESMQHNKLKNMMDQIKLDKVEIIKVRDLQENSKDTFSASISGSMIDYRLDERNGSVIEGSDQKSRNFIDIYHFVRKDEHWLLDRIENDPNFLDIFFLGGNKKEA
jgi:hypothetical protein